MADGGAGRLILASGSSARCAMLAAAGVRFDVIPADVDEAALRNAFCRSNLQAGSAAIADLLARAKAEHVSRLHPDALVIGSDQVLDCGGVLFEKPEDLANARASLLALRGRMHTLQSAVALAAHGHTQWAAHDAARLTMRAFSDAFLDEYAARAGTGICSTVGAYKLEDGGIQLFEAIDGDYFTILGMPLLPLLDELRRRELLTK